MLTFNFLTMYYVDDWGFLTQDPAFKLYTRFVSDSDFVPPIVGVEAAARSISHSLSCGVTRVVVTFVMGKADKMSLYLRSFLPTPWGCFVLISFVHLVLVTLNFQCGYSRTHSQRTGSLMAVSYRLGGNSFCDIVSQYPISNKYLIDTLLSLLSNSLML
ncbi:hypothetical protein BGY98DRAFT_89137 [Russula aff. rugulosa BPL654]|nr:hypothetical protein BGY98DRAFT_89137 [Russula aff. rugulosa BPL654]